MDQQNSLTNIGILLHSEKWRNTKNFTCAFKNTKCVSAGLQSYRGCSCVFPVRTLSFQSVHRRGLSHSGPTAGPWGADTDLPQHFILAVETSHKVSACGWLSLMETKVTAGAAIITWLVSVTQTQIHTRTSACAWSLLKYIATLWIATLMGFTFVPLVFFYRKCLLNSFCFWLSFLNFSLF